ncbi:peptidase domain-containing ABC transporter [Anaerobranca gottschalkii]|uniref:peptidase domain-containing ABC transporter n=1 Tax=Anaerobranca gottschalkii TaxID=108328 RepID=UPI001A9A4E03|nr:peptidase domain-containing ABC transporter [Anaerobranca gottschalkii]
MLLKKWPCVMQHDASDCAAAVVSTILLSYKQETTLMKIREIIGTDAYGTTVKGIVEGLEKLKFNVKAVRTTTEEITKELTYPAIAQVITKEGLNHFIVIHKVTRKDKIIVADPAQGIKTFTREEFDKIFTGIMIFAIPTSEFETIKLKNKGMFNLFVSLILPQKSLLITIILASILLTIFGIISSFFSKIIMDEIIPYGLKRSLYMFLIIFGIVSLIQNLISSFRQHILLYLSRKIDIPVLLGYYNHIIHLPYSFFGTRKTGDIITRFQDAMTIKNIFTSVAISLVLDVTLAVISSIILWYLNSRLFIILAIMLLINVILIYIFKKPYRKINYEQMEAGATLNSQLIESIKNIDTVKSQNDEKEQMDKLEKRFVTLLQIRHKEGVLQNVQGFISTFINSLGNIFLLGIGALYIIDGKMTIGDLLVFQTLSQFFIEPVQNLVGLQITFQEAQVAMNRLSELMGLEREDSETDDKIKDVDLNGDIEFRNVTFAYGSRPPVIKDFSLSIPQGKKIAIVGESGAGKSTLAKLLLKFITPKEGEITIAGYSLSDIDHNFLRQKIAYIPQNIQLFTGTIIENLKVGNPNATLEEIMEACKKAGASDFIEKLPNRYNSYIEEEGGNLSGGEKQRLAIARALLSDSQILIFDEATSNLDSFSEKQVQNFIFKKIKDKTTIIIAHRLSTIINCDLICLIEKGKIVEQGTHEELMELNGKYASLAKAQIITKTPSKEKQKENTQLEEVTYE